MRTEPTTTETQDPVQIATEATASLLERLDSNIRFTWPPEQLRTRVRAFIEATLNREET